MHEIKYVLAGMCYEGVTQESISMHVLVFSKLYKA